MRLPVTQESTNARVHLIWPSEHTPSGSLRSSIVEGAVFTVTGELEGVTTEQEAIVVVRKIHKID